MLLKDKRKTNWFWIQNEIIDSEELTIYEKMVYMVLVRHANEGSACFPSYKSIAKKAGCSDRQVMKVIKSLEEKKLVKKVIRKQKDKKENDTNVYYVLSFKEENTTKKNNENTEHVMNTIHHPSEHDSQHVMNEIHHPSEHDSPPVMNGVHPNNTNINNTNINNTNIKSENSFSDDSIEYRLSKFLLSHIRKNNPNAKEPNLQKWSKQFDFILRLDRRSLDEIKEIIKWCHQEDNFWSTNILSPKSLRKQYDKLVMQKKYSEKTRYQKEKEDELSGFEVY